MNIDPGELDQRVTLRRKTEVANDYGTMVQTDSDYATVWARVRPMSGGERDRGQQTEARANYVVIIRNRSDVQEQDYVVWRGNEMNIRFIKDYGTRPLYLEIECERGAP